MQRNVRYQHAYGVILLIAAKLGNKPYRAIWCEQFEDLLAERYDDRFDGYQIKTRRPETGAWTISDPEFVRSLGRFCDLVSEFGDQIADLYFVSNTECDSVSADAQNQKRRGRCPNAFLEHIKTCQHEREIGPPFLEAFNHLVAETAAEPVLLFSVLSRTSTIVGPSRGDLDAAITQHHVALLPGAQTLNATQLSSHFEKLMMKVSDASSLKVVDGMRHLFAGDLDADPSLRAKRLDVEVTVAVEIDTVPRPAFSQAVDPILVLGTQKETKTLETKLAKGEIDEAEIDNFRTRALVAEYTLLEDVQARPEEYPALQTQIERVVLGECIEAFLRAKQGGEPFGERMMIDVQDRLRTVAQDRPQLVGFHEYETLIGVAGLLTGECRIWWSRRFRVEAA
jgi:Cap4-like dsDNA endonuclease family protein